MRFEGLFLVFGILFGVSFVSGIVFNLISISPSHEVISMNIGENQIFTIQNNSYDGIKWYFENELVAENVLFFELETDESGVYSLRVNVVGEDLIDSRAWNVIVKEPVFEENVGISWGEIVFYMIVTILLIVIFLVVRLFILEKRESL